MPHKFSIKIIAFALAALTSVSSWAATTGENYRFYCAQCHGESGRGDGPNALPNQPAIPRNLTDTAGMRGLTDEDIVNVIKDGGPATGRSTFMPPFGKTLTNAEINSLKDYLRRLCKC